MIFASCMLVITIDLYMFHKFPKMNFFNMGLELLLSLFILVPLFAIQNYKRNKFYFNLNIGFFLLFLSYFVDAVDQIFMHSILFTVLMEKTTLVCAAVFIYIGSKQWMQSFEKIALTDYLTQIPNRKLISQIIETEICHCKKYGGCLSIAIIDIDYFKNINDEFGHNTGDEVLKMFSSFLIMSLDHNDEIGRWGGEEFVVLIKDTKLSQAKFNMEKLRTQIESEKFLSENFSHQLTVSIGLSQWTKASDNFESLFIKADKALYQAKKSGRNKVEV